MIFRNNQTYSSLFPVLALSSAVKLCPLELTKKSHSEVETSDGQTLEVLQKVEDETDHNAKQIEESRWTDKREG